jgi:hypothetical protein
MYIGIGAAGALGLIVLVLVVVAGGRAVSNAVSPEKAAVRAYLAEVLPYPESLREIKWDREDTESMTVVFLKYEAKSRYGDIVLCEDVFFVRDARVTSRWPDKNKRDWQGQKNMKSMLKHILDGGLRGN